MTFARDLSGNNPIDLKYSPYNRTAADLTAVLALVGLYPGEIVEALNTGRKYRWLGSAWGLIGPVTSVVAGTLPQPNVTINQAAGQADPTGSIPIQFTVVFSQDVTGFVTGDVTLSGTATGTLVGTVSGGPNTYVVSVTGMTSPGTVIASVGAGVATGPGGLNQASTSTDNVVTLVGPDVNVAAAAGQASPTSTTPINFTVTFSQPVTGFVTGDVSFTSSTAGGTLVDTVTGGPSVYNVAVTGMTTNGSVTVSVPAGSANGPSGLGNNAGFPGLVNWVAPVVDTTPPEPSMDRHFLQADPTNVSPIRFQAAWSEAVLGFDGSDISFVGTTAGGTLSAFTTQTSPTTYDVFVSGMTTNGEVVASIPAGVCTDTSGNPNIASVSTDNSVTWTGGAGGGFPDDSTSASEFPILFV